MHGTYDETIDYNEDGFYIYRVFGEYDLEIDPYNNNLICTVSMNVTLTTEHYNQIGINLLRFLLVDNTTSGSTIMTNTEKINTYKNETVNLGSFSNTYSLQKNGVSRGNIVLRIKCGTGPQVQVANFGKLKSTNMLKKISGTWKDASPFIKVNNTWKRCKVWKKINGVWKN